MYTIDIVMPAGGSRGGVEYVINSWTKSFLSEKYDLRIFHVVPGKEDYLDGYEKQWAVVLSDEEIKKAQSMKLDVDYCAECYADFVQKMGPPDICIATWIPIMTTACHLIRESMGLNYKLASWLHSTIKTYKELGWGGIEHLNFADVHLCLSQNTGKEILDYYPEKKVYVIGNPVKKPVVSEGIVDDRKLCFVGRIVEEKRLDVILKALSETKDKSWSFVIAGDGSLMEDMKALAGSLDIEKRVDFLGWQDDPWEQVKDSAVLVSASDYEGFSIMAHEASSLGMTVITTPVNGCTDYITPGVNGYFFDNGSPKNLTDILDFISSGVLPICDRQTCADSVSPYLWDNYFNYVDKCLEEIIMS